MTKRCIGALAAAWLLALLVPTGARLQAQAAPDPAFFQETVQPILAANCLACHGPAASGGLRLDSRDAVLAGGNSGPAVVPGDPDASLLMAAVRQTGDLKMPLGGAPLPDEQIEALATWIADGADWPEVMSASGKPESMLAEEFEQHIRPVLAQQCFACHTNSQSGGLRLDTRDDMLAGGDTGPAIVPGDPEASLLIASLKHTGTLKMPKGGTRLTDEQIGYFEQWIADGAFWPQDLVATTEYSDAQWNVWSVLPFAHDPVPTVQDTAWPRNDIDRFVLAGLESRGLTPAPDADRRTLLRRVTYDLTGLMPTYEEVEAFVNDDSPDAWETVVDRLLASPRYGERWARHWMDVVRYGEDDYRVGKRPDRDEKYPFAYLYRDWLIRSFNEDMPYDTFVKAQLAADLFPEDQRDHYLPALGMHGNGIWIFHANPAPIERSDEWFDKVDVTSKALLGLTVGCARCHDHKYDAIYTKDYYQLASVFASSNYHAYPRVPQSVVDEYDAKKEELEQMQDDLDEFLEDASGLYAQMLLAQAEDYMVAAWRVGSDRRATVESVSDDMDLDPEILRRWIPFLEKQPDNYPALESWQAMVAEGGTEEQAEALAHDFVAKVKQVNEDHIELVKENEIALAEVKDEDAPFDPLPNGIKRDLNAYQIDLASLSREDTLLWTDVFDRDVPAVTANAPDDAERKPGLLKLTDGALERRLPADLRLHVEQMRDDIDAFKEAMPPQYPFIYGIAEAEQPSDLKVFVRGNPYSFGADAPRAFLSILSDDRQPEQFSEGSGRLELAEAIVNEPIAARVITNRVWRWHMGRGIVETPNNFGTTGDQPTDPALLDYMAEQFVANGMSFKALHKMILMSRTYQLSAEEVPGNLSVDASNERYWRANRVRVDAEGVWDLLLEASGRLDVSEIGGPSADLTDDMTRRGVYATVSRMYPSSFQSTFDLPAATISTEKRFTTNVPQQRLFFLNSTFVREQAVALADRVEPAGGPADQVRKAFEIVYQRQPTPEELDVSVGFVSRPVPADVVVAESGDEAAAPLSSPLQSFCWALLSSNEFLFID